MKKKGHKRKMKKIKIFMWLLACVVCFSVVGFGPTLKTEAAGNYNLIKTVSAKSTPRGKWIKNKKGYRYRYTYNKKYAKKVWYKIKGKIYYLDKKGYRTKGIKKYKGNYYYLNKNGVLKTGWITYNGNRYYFAKKSGEAKIGWQMIGGKRYYFDSKGRLQENMQTTSGKIIFVGDSRTVGMKSATGSDDVYIAKVGEGYSWLRNTAEAALKNQLTMYPDARVVINLGVNDLGNVDNYITRYKTLITSYPQATFYFLSVNPVEKKLASSKGYNVTYVNNTKIQEFNKKIKSAFGATYIDSYSHLVDNGYIVSQGKATADGIHYTTTVSKVIYNYVLNHI